jgi:hypothetical protein
MRVISGIVLLSWTQTEDAERAVFSSNSSLAFVRPRWVISISLQSPVQGSRRNPPAFFTSLLPHPTRVGET